jgi:CrcB protein
MQKVFLIGLGGALGTILRYIVSSVDYRFSGGIFPVSTFVINATGSLVIGFLWGFFERVDVASGVRLFILIGLLGGYTTFSTFALENLNLLRDGEIKIAIVNIIATNALGLLAVFLGFNTARMLFRIL